MRRHFHPIWAALFICVATILSSRAWAQQTAFTYQGSLTDGGAPASGLYDFQFQLDADAAGTTNLFTFATNGIAVSNGVFTTLVDFGPGSFYGSNYWLQLGVRTNGATTFVEVNPLQPLTPTPHALFADSASNVLGALSSSQLTGTIPTTQLPSGLVTNGAKGINLSGSFSGDATGLTNLFASSFVFAKETDPVAITNFTASGQEISFTTNANWGFISGWTFTNNTPRFFADQAGTYLIEYHVSGATTNPATEFYVKVQEDAGGILPQSAARTMLETNSTTPIQLYGSALVKVAKGHSISLVINGEAGLSLKGIGVDCPAASIKITRIQ